MKGILNVLRRNGYAEFEFDADENISVSGLLEEINSRSPLLNRAGEAEPPIEWECSCGQTACGACAMVINGVPSLACGRFLRETGPKVTLEPLSKFPCIADLRVDRSAMYSSLEELKIWVSPAKEGAKTGNAENLYTSAGCIMCGCCLEVCPNYSGKDKFFGAAGMNASYRTVNQTADTAVCADHLKLAEKHGMGGCSKSLSCERVCPAKIPLSMTVSQLSKQYLISRLPWKR